MAKKRKVSYGHRQNLHLSRSLRTAPQIKDHLDSVVVGQELAKRKLSVAVANHYARLAESSEAIIDPDLEDVTIEKSNILLIGPTGCGKTYLARAIAASLAVPFAAAEATSLTESGYVGQDVETVLSDLIMAANGDIDAAQKARIFTNNPDTITSVSISLPDKSKDAATIIVDAKTADIIPQTFRDVYEYIANLKEIAERTARKSEEINLKIKSLVEVKKANLIFLNQITEMISNQRLTFYCNPADLIRKDAEISSEIMSLQRIKTTAGILVPLSIARQPSKLQIQQRIFVTGILSLIAGIFMVLFLDYIDRMKARENR